MIVPARLRDGDAVESDVTLTEQRLEQISGYGREVRNVHILFRSRDQFTPDIEFDM